MVREKKKNGKSNTCKLFSKGPVAFLKYLGVCTVTTGLVLLLFGMFEPLFVKDIASWSIVTNTGYFGFQPGLMACFVALKQVMPDTQIAIFFLFRIKLGQLPLFALTLTSLAGIIMPSRGVLSMLVAFPVSWFYLRYFSYLYNRTTPGDMRDSFSLATFFPAAISPYILPLAKVFFLFI